MILYLDAGNTRLKWGVHHCGAWVAQGICAHPDTTSLGNVLPAGIEHILACNVAGAGVATRIVTLAAQLGVPLRWFRSEASACGLTNLYDCPELLGPDRWAAMIGARLYHAGPCVVVMAGTATTIDVLDRLDHFRGGVILPGLSLMVESLARNTAGLPAAHGSYRKIPTNTDDAIVSGALHATLGSIERVARAVTASDFCILLSGGAAHVVAPHLDQPYRLVENLVLDGLSRFPAGAVW